MFFHVWACFLLLNHIFASNIIVSGPIQTQIANTLSYIKFEYFNNASVCPLQNVPIGAREHLCGSGYVISICISCLSEDFGLGGVLLEIWGFLRGERQRPKLNKMYLEEPPPPQPG